MLINVNGQIIPHKTPWRGSELGPLHKLYKKENGVLYVKSSVKLEEGWECWDTLQPSSQVMGIFTGSNSLSLAYECSTLHILTPITLEWYQGMALFCETRLTTITGIEKLDVSKCTNLSRAFQNVTIANLQLDLKGWNISNATDLSYMFALNRNPTQKRWQSLDIRGWDFSGVQNMEGFLYHYTNTDVIFNIMMDDYLNTVNTTNFKGAFYGYAAGSIPKFSIASANTLELCFHRVVEDELDLSNPEFIPKKDQLIVDNMFSECGFKHIYVNPKWTNDKLRASATMFTGATALHNWDGNATSTRAVIDDGTNQGYFELIPTT